MFVKKTSVLPASKYVIFQKIKKLKTLQYIAKPYATFEPVSNAENGAWTVGGTSSYRFRLFGIIPSGTHTIHIVRFDPDGISSREGNEHVPVWNHDITMVCRDSEGAYENIPPSIFIPTKRKTLENLKFCVYILDGEVFLICISREISF